jgi:hypothetical protein
MVQDARFGVVQRYGRFVLMSDHSAGPTPTFFLVEEVQDIVGNKYLESADFEQASVFRDLVQAMGKKELGLC